MQAIARKGYNKRRRTEKPTINNRILSFNDQVDVYWQQNTLADWREIILIQSNIASENSRHFATLPLVSPRMTPEERVQKFHTDDASLPRSRWCFWLVVPLGKFASTNQKHYPDLGSDVSSVWNFCARSFRGETSGGVTKCRLFLRLSQTPLIRTMRRPKQVDILMGCSCNERAFFSQGQSKLSVIMSFPY